MQPSLRDNLRAMPAAAWFLFLGTFVNRFGSFVLIFLVLFVTGKGYSAAEAGGALGAYGIGSLLAAYSGGQLADRFGRRNTIALSMFTAAAALILLSQADSLLSIALLTGLTGFTSELYRPASSALLADLVRPEHHLTAFALYRLAINAGFAAGPAVGGFLAGHSWLYLFVGDAITCAIFGVIALVALPGDLRRRGGEHEVDEATALRLIARDRLFVRYLIASTMIAFVFFQFSATFPLQIRDLGLSTVTYGLLLSLNGVMIIALELTLTIFTQRFRRTSVIALGFLLVGIGFAMHGVAHGAAALAAAVVVWTFGEIISAPMAGVYVASLAPERLRGRYMGAWGLTWSIGLILAPVIGTAVYEVSSPALWALCGVIGIGAASLVLSNRAGEVQPLAAPSEA